MPKFTDPIGPGTMPWKAFDRALQAAQQGRFNSYGPGRKDSFPQKRASMRYYLRQAGADEATIEAWTWILNTRVANAEFDEE